MGDGWRYLATRLITAFSVAIPISSLCINRRLYKISAVQAVTISRQEKRRDMIFDLSLGIGVPVLQMALRELRLPMLIVGPF